MSRTVDISGLTTAQVEAVRRLLERPKYELIPLKNAIEQTKFLPEGAVVSITASPQQGMTATIDLAIDLKERGFVPTPHIAARQVVDSAELEIVLKRLDEAAINEAFIVGGDAEPRGEFFDAIALLTAMEHLGHGLTEIGVPGYPEGHHIVDDATMEKAIHEKVPYVSYMTTQMCFVPDAVETWVHHLRDSGIGLGVYIGVPGVVELSKLLSISMRIGVGASAGFLAKNKGLAGKLVRPGGYSPDDLIVGLAPLLADPVANITGFHLYTFNRVGTTETWRQRMLDVVGGSTNLR